MSIKKIVTSVVLAVGCLTAAPVSPEKINNVALNFASRHGAFPQQSLEVVRPSQAVQGIDTESVNYKIIRLRPTGWVIVSTDDVARPVLAYNLEDNRTRVMPENFKNWMKGISEEIEWAKNSGIQSAFSSRWKELTLPHDKYLALQKSSEAEGRSESTAVKGPLLQMTWDQGRYYNAKCPADSDGPDGHVWAGCVATAMVQIMKYYNWPNVGKGSHSYESDYGTLSADFGATRYRWQNMPTPRVTDYNDDVATILYHAGVSVNMQYSPDGSGAYMSDAESALRTYFRYHTSGRAFKNNMSDEEWEQLLKREIDARRPVLYAGYGTGGHAFVCDGYDFSDSNDKKFHFNWGWSGYYNGYYAISALNPGGSDFNDGNEIIYGIKPVRLLKAPSNVRASNITRTGVVLRWKDNSRNEKGFKIYRGTHVIKRVKANVTKAKVGRLIPGTRYTLRVASYRGVDESRAVPVRFKTLGKRPAILPIYLNQTVDGKLTDRFDSIHRSGAYAKYYTFKLSKRQKVEIVLSSSDFDTYLFLLDGKGKDRAVLAENDDSSGTDSEITVDLEAGSYTIEASSYSSGATGSFTLSFKKAD